MSHVAANVEQVRQRIGDAAERAGRSPDDVTLMAVTKTVDPARIEAALDAGVRVVGESRVQEAEEKIPRVVGDAAWHFVGRLQSNKARMAGALFEAVHSVDRDVLAERLSDAATQRGRPVDVYIQVDLDEEPPEERLLASTEGLCRTVSDAAGLRLRGLMTLPPFDPDPESARPYFLRLRRLRDELRARDGLAELKGLSMGMTNDFEVAVEEGATIVRVGTAIFGERPTP